MNHIKRKRTTLIALAAVLLWALGYPRSDPPPKDPRPHIAATTTMLYELTAAIAGDAAVVIALMGPGVDPHLYQATAGDMARLQEADAIVYNGLHLEGRLSALLDGLADPRVICAASGIDASLLLSDAENPGLYDPHIWLDPALWRLAAIHIAGQLSALDAANAAVYIENLGMYLAGLEALDSYNRERFASIPEANRVLVTAHDAFGYFGRAYQFQTRGLQGISTDTEAGAADVMALADFVAARRLPAIFNEAAIPPKAIRALQEAAAAKGHTPQIGGTLHVDALAPGQSYVQTMRGNADIIAGALGSDEAESTAK